MSSLEGKLRELAAEVRTAAEQLREERHPSVRRIENILVKCGGGRTSEFPRHWCDFATVVLARHISRELNRGDVFLVSGGENYFDQHKWVVVRGFLVDITCDQFEAAPRCPVVSRSSPWHAERYPVMDSTLFAARPYQAPYFERSVLALSMAVESTESVSQARHLRALSSRPRRKA